MARKNSRRRSSRRTPRLDFAAIEIVGALLTPDIVARIASFDSGDQTEEAYGIPPGLKVRDEIARYFRIGEALWHQFDAAKANSPAASERFVLALLKECFGFDGIKAQKTIRKDERDFPVRHAGLDGRVPLVIAPVPAESARRSGVDESLSQFGDGSRRRSATLLLQEYLNAEDEALWGICADGLTLRLLRDNVSLTRPAWIEADLARIFTEGLFPDFSALWLLLHQSRFGRADALPADCALERWRDTGRIEGVAARDKLRQGVEQALLQLGQGFIEHPANNDLRKALTDGSLTRQGYFEQLLRLVYRLIFLFAAEDRDLLHLPGASQAVTKAYTDGYSVARLRERCTRRTSWDKNTDVWEGLKATFHALAEGQSLLGLPALGGLFTHGQHPHLRASRIENRRLLAAIWRLAWMRPEGQPLTRVNWRDMETEELGSVYEGLLELTPQVSASERSFAFAEGLEGRGNARKTSGSYYTPDALVQALLDETLDPLVEQTIAGKDDQSAIDALLNLRIVDPACGSGHFLLAAARRLASRIARLSSPGTPSQSDYRHWLREVARRTLFGVDKNPMAIELAKVALWIETVEPGKPLSFLDAHLRCGDSLLGVYDLAALQLGIPDDAFKALTGDDKKAASAWKARNKSERDGRKQGELTLFEPPRALMDAARKLEQLAEDDIASVRKKAETFREIYAGGDRHRFDAACDLYIAAFLMAKTEPPVKTVGGEGAYIPTSRDVWDKLAGAPPMELLEQAAVAAARAAGAFHWPLEFPQVFFPGSGRSAGFDLALGNPPWERIKLQELEFFAAHDPEIAAVKKSSERKKLISNLAQAEIGSAKRVLLDAYVFAKRLAEATSEFVRISGDEGGRYPLTGTGDVNTYALFAELFATIINTRGRAGYISPTGIATDASTAKFFGELITTKRLSALYDFENRDHIFDGLHTKTKFCIIAISIAPNKSARLCFMATKVSDITDARKLIQMDAAELARFNPNTKTSPIFRSRRDAELTAKIYGQAPIFISHAPPLNAWGGSFSALFHMSNDSDLFLSEERAGTVRLYEAKMFWHFDHRWAHFDGSDDARLLTLDQKKDPQFLAGSRYWVPAEEVASRLPVTLWPRKWMLAFRNVSDSRNERTFVSTILPRTALGNSGSIIILRECAPAQIACLLANLNSLVLDFVARQKIPGMNVNFFMVEQFPIFPPDRYRSDDLAFIVPRVLELTYTAVDLCDWAADLGYQGAPFEFDIVRRGEIRAELDAYFAKLYGLSRDDLAYILDPSAVMGADYPSETFRVLRSNETEQFGEYRTQRLLLEAFDRLQAGNLSSEVSGRELLDRKAHTPEPVLDDLQEGAWARPRQDQRGETGVTMVALLKAMQGPMSAQRVRLASILALEPRLLHSHLNRSQSAEWKRLVGDEAEPLPSGAVQFVPPTDQHWGAVVRGLRTSGALIEDSRTGTWAPGRGLDQIDTQGWPDGRARFVLDALRAADEDTVVQTLPAEVRRWLDAEAA